MCILKFFKCIKDVNIRSETIQLLEENIGRIFFDKNCSNTFLDVSLKAKAKKSKINKWDQIRGQPTEWEKIFANND